MEIRHKVKGAVLTNDNAGILFLLRRELEHRLRLVGRAGAQDHERERRVVDRIWEMKS